jgi:glycosyltransferase involved in cell wall biosynthesis
MRVAVITPRYGPEVVGGAETLARGFAEAAASRGWEVEVWTTCARSHYTWENLHPPGAERRNGVLVRRFPVERWDREQWADLELRLAHQGFLPSAEAYAWLESGPHSPRLYAYVARHAAGFEAVVALPYATPLIHYAAWAAPERVILWPCLHDEPYAYLEPVCLLLESVWGVVFNSPEEADLAVRRLNIRPHQHAVLGGGVCSPPGASPRLFWKRLGRFLMYAGRLEEGKNILLLYDYARRYFEEKGTIRLVIIGTGPVKPPKHPAFVDLGLVSEEEKAALYRAALALCQPSLRESFSLTIMESWLAERPVLVHEDCPVTSGQVRRSRGGLWFRTYEEFAEAVDWLLTHPDLATRMGENGKRYVLSNYTWEAVLNHFEALIQQWRET